MPAPILITVNGERHAITSATLSYEDVVVLAYGEPARQDIVSITYHYDDRNRVGGILAPGRSVDAIHKMRFYAYYTDAA